MSILQFKTEPVIRLTEIANGIKDLDTQIKQLQHQKKEMLSELQLSLDEDGMIYEDGVLIAKKPLAFRNTFNIKKFKEDHADLHGDYVEENEIEGRWFIL